MKRFRNALFCIVLALASATGAPMRPDEVEELMLAMSQPKVVTVIRARQQDPIR